MRQYVTNRDKSTHHILTDMKSILVFAIYLNLLAVAMQLILANHHIWNVVCVMCCFIMYGWEIKLTSKESK